MDELDELIAAYRSCYAEMEAAGEALDQAEEREEKARYAKEEAEKCVRAHIEMRLAAVRVAVKGER